MIFNPFLINHNFPPRNTNLSFDELMNHVANNIGNSYITNSILKLLNIPFDNIQGISNIWTSSCCLSPDTARQIHDNYSHVILIMQDQIREHDSYYDHIDFEAICVLLERIKLPILTLSLGHNSFGTSDYDKDLSKKLNPGLIKLLHILSKKSVSLGVRGVYTAEILNSIGIKNISVSGCPSYFANGIMRQQIQKKKWNSNLKIGLTGAMGHLDNKNFYFIPQDVYESPVIKAVYYPDELTQDDFLYFKNLSNTDNFPILEKIFSKRVFFNHNIPQWESFLKGMDFVAGSRMHGAIVALNNATPAVVTSGDSRAKEMCQLFRIPHFPGRIDLHNMYEEADFTETNNQYKHLFENFSSFIFSNLQLNIVKKNHQDDNNSSVKLKSPQYKKINFGCGFNKLDAFLNVDVANECHPNMIVDLESFPWPWESDTVEEAIFNHSLEHIGRDQKTFFSIICELYRVCKHNAKITINTPHPRSDAFLSDPTHVRPLSPEILRHFSLSFHNSQTDQIYNTSLAKKLGVDFEIISTSIGLEPTYSKKLKDSSITSKEFEKIISEHNNIIKEYKIQLIAKKDTKQEGSNKCDALVFDVDENNVWIEVVFAFLNVFSANENIALIISIDSSISSHDVESGILEIARGLEIESFPQIVLLTKDENRSETYNNFSSIVNITLDPTLAIETNPFAERLRQARLKLASDNPVEEG